MNAAGSDGRFVQLVKPGRPGDDVMGIDLHHLVDGIPTLPPAVQLLIKQPEPEISFTSSQAVRHMAKVHEADESVSVISVAALHLVGKQVFDQKTCWRK